MLFCACQFFCILEKFSVLILFNVFLIPLGFYISFAISHDSYVWSLHTILEFFDIMVIFLKKLLMFQCHVSFTSTFICYILSSLFIESVGDFFVLGVVFDLLKFYVLAFTFMLISCSYVLSCF